jgi:hypothetical protein
MGAWLGRGELSEKGDRQAEGEEKRLVFLGGDGGCEVLFQGDTELWLVFEVSYD